jgi:predicted alpha/beta superfamily hydrolase
MNKQTLGWWRLIPVLLATAACSKNEMKGIMEVTFEVEAPGLGTNDVVYITGNHQALGDWEPYEVPLYRREGDLWSRTLAFPYGARLEYKFTLGGWISEGLDEEGHPLPNFTVAATRSQSVRHRISRWASDGPPAASITGRAEFHRNVAGQGLLPRDVVVWLPPGYADSEERYPVLYMHDGQNTMDPTTSFLGTDWGVDEAATRLIGEGRMHPVIIVGMYNTPQRMEDYGSGEQGAAYQRFVVDVVKPLIDQTYRTKPGRDDTAVMGSSMGGLVSFLLAWNHAEVFKQAACLSPAFFPESVKLVREAAAAPDGMRVYMDNGTEGLEQKIQAYCDDMLAALPEKGFVQGANFDWFLDQGAEHNEKAWAARLDRPLLFLFGTATDTP